MKRATLWTVSIRTSPDAEEAVTELLSVQFERTASAYVDARTQRVIVTAYCDARPADWKKKLQHVRTVLQELARSGLNLGSGRISVGRVKREQWAESWKRHFKPMAIDSTLLIKPSWSRKKPKAGQQVMIIDPGLSFGTGQHATTWFCLQQIVKLRNASGSGAFLDIGTGSGILAIAAAKLGYRPVRGFDIDPEAARIAQDNVRTNGLSGKVAISRNDIARLQPNPRQKYDLVCANLISTLLLAERHRIIGQVKLGGTLVLAGILRREFKEIQKSFEAMGLRKVAGGGNHEWHSGAFKRVGG